MLIHWARKAPPAATMSMPQLPPPANATLWLRPQAALRASPAPGTTSLGVGLRADLVLLGVLLPLVAGLGCGGSPAQGGDQDRAGAGDHQQAQGDGYPGDAFGGDALAGDGIASAGDDLASPGDTSAGDELPGGDQFAPTGDFDQPACGPGAIELAHTPLVRQPIGALAITASSATATTMLLTYRRALSGVAAVAVAMTPLEGGSWRAVIPAAEVTFAPLEYHLTASDGTCAAREPEDGEHPITIWGLRRLTPEPDVYNYMPAIFGDTVVWADELNEGQYDNVVLFDLTTFTRVQLTNLQKPQGPARVWGGTVAWVDGRLTDEYNPNSDIWAYDLLTGSEHQVTDNTDGQYGLAMHEHLLVWRDDRHMGGAGLNGDIYLYDLGPDGRVGTVDDGGELRLTSDGRDQTGPDVYVRGDGRAQVVWYDLRDDANGLCDAACDYNIYLADSGSDGIFGTADDRLDLRVTSDPDMQTSPAIGARYIAWLDARDTLWYQPEIWYYDLGPDGVFGTADDGGEARLPPPIVEAGRLEMDGNRLVYDDYRRGSYEVWLYDFDAQTELQLTDARLAQHYADVQGATIVWQDAREADPDNYVFTDDIWVYRLP